MNDQEKIEQIKGVRKWTPKEDSAVVELVYDIISPYHKIHFHIPKVEIIRMQRNFTEKLGRQVALAAVKNAIYSAKKLLDIPVRRGLAKKVLINGEVREWKRGEFRSDETPITSKQPSIVNPSVVDDGSEIVKLAEKLIRKIYRIQSKKTQLDFCKLKTDNNKLKKEISELKEKQKEANEDLRNASFRLTQLKLQYDELQRKYSRTTDLVVAAERIAHVINNKKTESNSIL